VGTALVGMFFFLTLFVQDVWGYSALRTAAAYLPFVPAVLVMTAVAQQGVSRVGARPLLIAGSAAAAGGMVWLSRLTEHSTFAGGFLGPELLLGAGLGLLFVPIPLVGLTKVNTGDTGVASSLVNVGQQVGGAIGLAIVGTVAWSAVASSLRSAAAAAAAAAQAGAAHRAQHLRRRVPRPGAAPRSRRRRLARIPPPPRRPRCRPRSTTTRWQPGSPGATWSRPAS